ncbi:hypothetical protein ACFLQW_00945 [Candidatus Zixiibacteriota bacterium]
MPVTDLAALIISLVCSAVLLGVAIESRHYPWVGWVGLTPLFLVIRALTPLRAMSCGALWGFCLYTLIVSGNSGAITPLDGSLAFLILIPALYTFAAAHLTRRIGFSPLFLAFGWVGVEFALRPFGLGSGLLSGSQGDAGIIQQVGAPLGYFFVAFLIALTNAGLSAWACSMDFDLAGSCRALYFRQLYEWIKQQLSCSCLSSTIHTNQSRAPPEDGDLRFA